MGDDAAVFLLRAAEEAGHIDKRDQRNVEGVAEADETRRLAGGVDVQDAGQHLRLVGDDSDALAAHVGESHQDVAGEVGMYFKELAVIYDALDDSVHVVGLVGAVGNDFVQRIVGPAGRILGRTLRGGLQVVLGQEGEQLLDHGDAFPFVIGGEMGNAAPGSVDGGSAQVFLGDGLAGDLLDDAGARQEHVGRVFHHQGEVGQGGGVNGSAGAGTEHAADLGDDAGGQDVALEDLAIARQGVDPFLDPGASAVVEADDRSPVAQGHVHHLADLFGHGLAEGSAVDGEILGKDVHEAAADGTLTRHYAVSVEMLPLHAEVGAAVPDKHVILLETPFVQQQREALACRHLTFPVLGGNPFRPTALEGGGAALDQIRDVLPLNTHPVKF